ncbi:transglutaminase [Nostocales cyanobacterium HT-58-2]|nr:transglutaminase [Nostocales cyanobacterium HT-58-2]
MFNKPRIGWRLPASLFWRQNMQESPLMEVENSISLRVLVLALVIVGIVATDTACETKFSLWSLPLSTVGAFWSYYRRHNRNVSVKFCIAIGMLVALGAFFGRLFGELNDTRLALAELLIQLQVLHSFDMPRRKDLGYSIVIGLILLGVAATLSQTLAFAPVLLFFLAIALPTLVLDYRSRLGLQPLKMFSGSAWERDHNQKSSSHFFTFYFLLFTLVVGLGLGIFAVLPRFPGYQLRMFPVSSPINIKGDFTGRSIINRGYVRQGHSKNQDRGESHGGEGNQIGEPGLLNDSFYYGFNSRINQNLRGMMKPKVVMRVRSQSSGFWRVLAFDHYTGQGWEISRNEQVQTLKRSPWAYQFFLPFTGLLGKNEEIVQTYTVVSDLPNLIPALASPKEIYFPTPIIAVDTEGSLRSPVELSEDLTYTVISQVPQRDRTLLGKAPTLYPQSIKKYYLQISPAVANKVKQHTEEILANYNIERVGKSQKTLDSPYEKALYLAQYLKQHYSLPKNPADLPYLSDKEDLVEAFLFKYKGGYPDHFSTVLTVMLRSIGIPARLVAGFSPGEFNPFTGMYIVRNTDAYAMTEVYFPNYGWFAFDPIPNHPLIPPSIEDDQTFSVVRQLWTWIAGWLPSPVTGLLNNMFGAIFSWITRILSGFFSLFSRGWLGILTGVILTTALTFLSWIGWGQWREWRDRFALLKLPPMENLYQQMLKWATKKGLGKHPAQTPLEYATGAYQHYSPATAQIIDEICQAYVSWRYGGHAPNLNQLRKRWQELQKNS